MLAQVLLHRTSYPATRVIALATLLRSASGFRFDSRSLSLSLSLPPCLSLPLPLSPYLSPSNSGVRLAPVKLMAATHWARGVPHRSGGWRSRVHLQRSRHLSAPAEKHRRRQLLLQDNRGVCACVEGRGGGGGMLMLCLRVFSSV